MPITSEVSTATLQARLQDDDNAPHGTQVQRRAAGAILTSLVRFQTYNHTRESQPLAPPPSSLRGYPFRDQSFSSPDSNDLDDDLDGDGGSGYSVRAARAPSAATTATKTNNGGHATDTDLSCTRRAVTPEAGSPPTQFRAACAASYHADDDNDCNNDDRSNVVPSSARCQPPLPPPATTMTAASLRQQSPRRAKTTMATPAMQFQQKDDDSHDVGDNGYNHEDDEDSSHNGGDDEDNHNGGGIDHDHDAGGGGNDDDHNDRARVTVVVTKAAVTTTLRSYNTLCVIHIVPYSQSNETLSVKPSSCGSVRADCFRLPVMGTHQSPRPPQGHRRDMREEHKCSAGAAEV
ncbi:hypothetical protein EDB92DRAFT_1942552 [Lactarius akahatsu]|uniref:Uncharacterized protein n=1 Tax=Lactarius akahatsu TaxID=416441 RepID=A0AAD4QFY8_9AGAM|nr:hypothetical protein EDB92DRAFT_1942552 [Lactarius akahatsu]